MSADVLPSIVGEDIGNLMSSCEAILLGRNTAAFHVWDGMRAIDYLFAGLMGAFAVRLLLARAD